mgnify:CR=1 FL=1
MKRNMAIRLLLIKHATINEALRYAVLLPYNADKYGNSALASKMRIAEYGKAMREVRAALMSAK